MDTAHFPRQICSIFFSHIAGYTQTQHREDGPAIPLWTFGDMHGLFFMLPCLFLCGLRGEPNIEGKGERAFVFSFSLIVVVCSLRGSPLDSLAAFRSAMCRTKSSSQPLPYQPLDIHQAKDEMMQPRAHSPLVTLRSRVWKCVSTLGWVGLEELAGWMDGWMDHALLSCTRILLFSSLCMCVYGNIRSKIKS